MFGILIASDLTQVGCYSMYIVLCTSEKNETKSLCGSWKISFIFIFLNLNIFRAFAPRTQGSSRGLMYAWSLAVYSKILNTMQKKKRKKKHKDYKQKKKKKEDGRRRKISWSVNYWHWYFFRWWWWGRCVRVWKYWYAFSLPHYTNRLSTLPSPSVLRMATVNLEFDTIYNKSFISDFHFNIRHFKMFKANYTNSNNKTPKLFHGPIPQRNQPILFVKNNLLLVTWFATVPLLTY